MNEKVKPNIPGSFKKMYINYGVFALAVSLASRCQNDSASAL